jgi:hypothetical protein
MNHEPDFDRLAHRFDAPAVRAIVLVGSFARGDMNELSDVDLLRFCDGGIEADGDGSHLVEGRLVTVSSISPQAVEDSFTLPERASGSIAGLRTARALIDRGGHFAAIQARARAFVWDAEMQKRADVWAGEQMVGWIEEVHKGLEGARSGGIGRMLNARFGLSWGLSRVIQVQRGVLVESDNTFFEQIEAAVGPHGAWARLRRAAFAIEPGGGRAPPTLREQVTAGLRLYVETARLLEDALTEEARPLVEATVARIQLNLTNAPYS